MSKVRRVDFSPDEWLAGTRALTPEERGLYWDCCALIYSRGGPIADDEEWLKKALACDPRTWRRVRARLIAARKLHVVDVDGRPHLMNGRAGREIEAAGDRIDTAREGGKASARKRAAATVGKEDRPDFGPTSARSSGEVPAKSGPDLSENNGLGPTIINHQPPTIDNRENLTVDRGARADDGDAPPPARPDPKGTRLPDEWRPEGDLRQWTIDTIRKAGSGVSAGHELERFRDYWHAKAGKDARKTNWDATWRNWIRKAIEMEGKGNGTNRQGGGQPQQSRPSNLKRAAAFAAGFGGPGDRGSSDGDG